ncbi:MAG: hypothetical protein ICV62_03510 [Cyanobacteria bacterium Co-bin13]|nr:hypothetical protein [Cyanobacteria bacterium Co-bin13]
MTDEYSRSGLKDQSVLFTSAALAALVLSLPWVIFRANANQWFSINPFKAVEADFLYEKALETGWEAAVAVQSAQGRRDWETVVARWGEAITMLEKVKTIPSNHSQEAKTKLAEYRGFQEYASERATKSLPEFSWEMITELAGQKSFVLVDPDRNDALSPGPRLDVEADHTITNIAHVNHVLSSLGLPPIPGASISPGENVQIRSNEYIIRNYPLGELSLHRTLCNDSFTINSRYDCLWKITLR